MPENQIVHNQKYEKRHYRYFSAADNKCIRSGPRVMGVAEQRKDLPQSTATLTTLTGGGRLIGTTKISNSPTTGDIGYLSQ